MQRRIKPLNPVTLLDRVLKLMDQDIKRIKKVARKSVQLDKDTAATLCKYASTISSIKEEKDAENLRRKKLLESKTTEELIAEFQKRKRQEAQQPKLEIVSDPIKTD